jgi:hypothetical protein
VAYIVTTFFDTYCVLCKEVASNHGSFSRSEQAQDVLLFMARFPVAVSSFHPLGLRHTTAILESKDCFIPCRYCPKSLGSDVPS